jgi:hypothetical protein
VKKSNHTFHGRPLQLPLLAHLLAMNLHQTRSTVTAIPFLHILLQLILVHPFFIGTSQIHVSSMKWQTTTWILRFLFHWRSYSLIKELAQLLLMLCASKYIVQEVVHRGITLFRLLLAIVLRGNLCVNILSEIFNWFLDLWGWWALNCIDRTGFGWLLDWWWWAATGRRLL